VGLLQELRAAKVSNLVVSSSGVTARSDGFSTNQKGQAGMWTITAVDEDRGCNEMWLRVF